MKEIEDNFPTLLRKDDKDQVAEVSTLHLNLFVSINDAEAQTTKNMERFKKTLKERLDKLMKEIEDTQYKVDNEKYKKAETDVEQGTK